MVSINYVQINNNMDIVTSLSATYCIFNNVIAHSLFIVSTSLIFIRHAVDANIIQVIVMSYIYVRMIEKVRLYARFDLNFWLKYLDSLGSSRVINFYSPIILRLISLIA